MQIIKRKTRYDCGRIFRVISQWDIFSAALYIAIAQHPASMKAGVPVAARFFPPMYGLAAPMQIVSALGGTLAGLGQWLLGGNIFWVVGAGMLVFVIPFTVIFLKPINDQLLDSRAQRAEPETEKLLTNGLPATGSEVLSAAWRLPFMFGQVLAPRYSLHRWTGVSALND